MPLCNWENIMPFDVAESVLVGWPWKASRALKVMLLHSLYLWYLNNSFIPRRESLLGGADDTVIVRYRPHICPVASHREEFLLMMSRWAMRTRWNLVSTSQFGTELSSSISTSPIIIVICKMPVKKYKPTLKNAGSGDVVILSSTSHYTAWGLVEKQTFSKHGATSSLEKSPSKSPQKPLGTNNLTASGGFDYDQAMLEPLSLPQSKVGLISHHDHTLRSLTMFVWFISL